MKFSKGTALWLNRKLKSWIIELRSSFLTATIVSILLGASTAWARNNVFNIQYFLLTLLGGVFLHLGANVANDYFDHKSGNDEVNREFVRPFSGGSRTIQLGLLTPREVLSGALLFFALGTSIGLFLTWVRGPFVLFLGLVGLFSGFFYTAPPFNLASRGIGEIFVGVNFGALMTLGAYYVQTQTLTSETLVASIPVSLLIAAVLYINEFPDYAADKAVGKNTLVVRLGRRLAVYGYALMILGAFASILISVLGGVTPIVTLIALAPLPLAVEATLHARKFYSNSLALVPSNALTIACHLFTSLLLSLGYLLYGVKTMNAIFVLVLTSIGFCVFSTAYLFIKTERKKRFQKFEGSK